MQRSGAFLSLVRRAGVQRAAGLAVRSAAAISTPVWRTTSLTVARPSAGNVFQQHRHIRSGHTPDQVQVIADLDEYNAACQKAAGKLIIAYHTAAWCGPCKMIWPYVQELAGSNPDTVFLKIDVDEAPDVASANDIKAMPTFLFVKGGEVKHKMVGASPQGLKEKVDALK